MMQEKALREIAEKHKLDQQKKEDQKKAAEVAKREQVRREIEEIRKKRAEK